MAPERLLIEPDDLTADFADSVIRQLQINQRIKARTLSFFDIARKTDGGAGAEHEHHHRSSPPPVITAMDHDGEVHRRCWCWSARLVASA